jgi:hypothetical protein
VNTRQGTIGDDTSTTALLGAPGDDLTLHVADGTEGGRGPEAEVIRIVHPGGLALAGLRVVGAVVVAELAVLHLGRDCRGI